jgi:hypothetical protein
MVEFHGDAVLGARDISTQVLLGEGNPVGADDPSRP